MKKKRKEPDINNIKWAIFGRNGMKFTIGHFFNSIGIYFRRLKYLKKYGCAEPAFWETDEWFICVMKEILTYYRYRRMATPFLIDDWDTNNQEDSNNRNEKAVDDYYDKMLELLDKMTIYNYYNEELGEYEEHVYEKMEAAKDEFMAMFSKIFYHLWE